MGGTFVLRIEDTDAARNSQEAVNVILNGLKWLGLDWDEGPAGPDSSGPSKGYRGPYFQSQRSALYRSRVQELITRGHAYEREGAIWFRMPREAVIIRDLVVGDVKRELTDREAADPDFVIVRSDGQPVFHLVNVVDDLEMGITHVIRGEDHLSNTAKHIALFRGFDAQPPKYAHIPLILNKDGSKMSKRDTGASMTSYMDGLYLPEALLNYLCLLGWSPKGNREVLAPAEVIQSFELKQILRHNARFDMEKLNWLNGEYGRTLTDERFLDLAERALRQAGLPLDIFPAGYVRAALLTCKGKCRTFAELPPYAEFYFREDCATEEEGATKQFVPENRPRVVRLREAFAATAVFDASTLEAALKAVAAELGIKAGVLVHPIRLACTGKSFGPSLYHLMEILGRERVLQRIDRALTSGGWA